MNTLTRGLLRGAAAGAAGTTALNFVTYLDMAVRGRGASNTPEKTVERLVAEAGASIPGDEETRQNRLSGLGPLTGLVTGMAGGAVLGLIRSTGLRLPLPVAATASAVGVMAMTDSSMSALGITEPRSWSPADWLADALPHAAYGVVTAWTARELAGG